jgi:hypothetical protein
VSTLSLLAVVVSDDLVHCVHSTSSEVSGRLGLCGISVVALYSHTVRVLAPVATMTDLAQVVRSLIYHPQFHCRHFQIPHYHCSA